MIRCSEIRHVKRLGSDAFYRVERLDGRLVEVSVVQAPGLERGARLRLDAHAVARMDVVQVPDSLLRSTSVNLLDAFRVA